MYPTLDKVTTGLTIKSYMEKNNISVKALQQYLGLSCEQTIYRWFEGENIPSIDNLYAMSELFQVDVDKLICGSRRSLLNDMEANQLIRLKSYSILVERMKY